MDPIFLYMLAVVFIGGPLLAAGYIWLRRRMDRWLQEQIEKKKS